MIGEFHPPARLLMGPGPSNVDPRVYLAMGKPMLGHLDPDFIRIMHQVQDLLREAFATGNSLTIPISGTGTAGMEAAFVNVVEPGRQGPDLRERIFRRAHGGDCRALRGRDQETFRTLGQAF